jgi:hypothetical protein
MFKIQFNDETTVSLFVTDGNESNEQVWEGDEFAVQNYRFLLQNAYGAFGHSFDTEFTTPIDLHYAVMSNLADFNPQVVEGAELVESYDPGIPEGAVT